MLQSQLKQITEELLRLKSIKVPSVDEKLKIQKLQQSLDSIFDKE